MVGCAGGWAEWARVDWMWQDVAGVGGIRLSQVCGVRCGGWGGVGWCWGNCVRGVWLLRGGEVIAWVVGRCVYAYVRGVVWRWWGVGLCGCKGLRAHISLIAQRACTAAAYCSYNMIMYGTVKRKYSRRDDRPYGGKKQQANTTKTKTDTNTNNELNI